MHPGDRASGLEHPGAGRPGVRLRAVRDHLADQDFALVARHRRNRVKPPTSDAQACRRLRRRWIVERTFAWLHSFRRVVTRFERLVEHYDWFVYLACAFIALSPTIAAPGYFPNAWWRGEGRRQDSLLANPCSQDRDRQVMRAMPRTLSRSASIRLLTD